MNLTIKHPCYYLGYNPEDTTGKPFILVIQTATGGTVKNVHFTDKESAVKFTQNNMDSVTVQRG